MNTARVPSGMPQGPDIRPPAAMTTAKEMDPRNMTRGWKTAWRVLARMALRRMSWLTPSNSRQISGSTDRVLMVLAPEMFSLKEAVRVELAWRTSRLARSSRRWKKVQANTMGGTTASTSKASFQDSSSMDKTAKAR